LSYICIEKLKNMDIYISLILIIVGALSIFAILKFTHKLDLDYSFEYHLRIDDDSTLRYFDEKYNQLVTIGHDGSICYLVSQDKIKLDHLFKNKRYCKKF